MNDCFLNLLFSFQLLLPLKEGADFVGSKQTIDVILSDLSLLGYVIPVGGLGIGLFICLLAYLAAEYNVRFQSHEKYKIAMNMLHGKSNYASFDTYTLDIITKSVGRY